MQRWTMHQQYAYELGLENNPGAVSDAALDEIVVFTLLLPLC